MFKKGSGIIARMLRFKCGSTMVSNGAYAGSLVGSQAFGRLRSQRGRASRLHASVECFSEERNTPFQS